MRITDSVRCLKGVGDKVESNLNKLGIFTVEDLLEYYPRAYQTYDVPVDVSEEFFIGTLRGFPVVVWRKLLAHWSMAMPAFSFCGIGCLI